MLTLKLAGVVLSVGVKVVGGGVVALSGCCCCWGSIDVRGSDVSVRMKGA